MASRPALTATTRSVARRRIVASVVLLLAVVAGLIVSQLLPDIAATDIAGDALYVVVIWCGVVLLAPRWRTPAVFTVVLAWCVAVELFQLTGLPNEWGAAFLPAMLVFGSVFDPRDLLVYAAAAVVLAVIDIAVRRGR